MKAEREIAGIAFPFAAGVTAAVIIGGSLRHINAEYHIISLWTAILSTAVLFLSHKREWGVNVQWGLVCAASLSCGIFIGLNGLELSISDISSGGPLAQTARRWAEGLERLIGSIPFEESSTGHMITALLTGNQEGISPDITQVFRDSGASHILALSGLHLGIIYAIVKRPLVIFGNTKAARMFRSALTTAICGAYTLATGAGASITRAFIFILLKEAAEMTGRRSDLKGILAASLMLHLAFDPTAAADVGFQLSYAAMFGIAYVYPVLKGMWRSNWPGLGRIWDSSALSISCQITTGPLAYHYFGTFPKYFLMTNLIAVPLVGIIIPMSLATILLAACGYCPEFMTDTTEWLVMTMNDALEVIASM
jgi:ComEC/Rec2-related protein